MASKDIKIVIKADNKTGKAFKQPDRDLGKPDKKTKNLTKTLKIGADVFVAFGVVAAVVGKKLINLASDAEEIQSKFDVVFRETQKDMNEWTETFASNVGRARQDIKKFTSGLGDVLKPLGFVTEEAGELSKEMVQLALDVASFNNRQDEDVIRAFTSAITGERESLKTLGIVITEADVKTEAYTSGLARQGAELSKTAKAQATINLLFKNSTDAQGDLIRTQDSFANKSKALQATLKDLGEVMGNFLLPMATAVVSKFTDIAKTFENLFGNVDALRKRFNDWITELDLQTGLVSAFKAAWDDIVLVFNQELKQALDELFIALEPLKPFFKAFAQVLGVVFVGALQLAIQTLRILIIALTQIFSAAIKVSTFFTNIFTKSLESIANIFERIISAIEKTINVIRRLREACGSSFFGGLAQGISQFAGARAHGGPVQAGKSFLVGERGAELFTPSQNGRITPASATGGGTTIIINNPVLLDQTMLERISEQLGIMLRDQLRV